MIFIYLGGGRSQLWLTLLGLAVTVLLNSGYLSNPSSYTVGPGGIDWSSSGRPVHNPWNADFAATPSLNLTWMVPAFAIFAFAASKAYFSIRRQGLRNSWRELCHSLWNWRPAAAGQQAHSNTATSKRRRFEAVSKIVQQLPVELYVSETDLHKLPLPELKKRLMSNGLNSKESLDKAEAVERILAAGNSSSISCTVCCDDYESGDALRVLKCGHKYHVECIDKWLLSSTDYLRAPACPICSAALSTEEH